MKMNNNKKMWSEPTITAVDRLKRAANGPGVAKNAADIEITLDGPGS